MPNSRSGVRITARAAQKWAWRPVWNRAAVHAVIGRGRRKESGQWGRAAPLRLLRLRLLCFRLVCGSFAPSLGCRLLGGLRLAALGRRPAPFDPIALGRVRPQPPNVLTPSCCAGLGGSEFSSPYRRAARLRSHIADPPGKRAGRERPKAGAHRKGRRNRRESRVERPAPKRAMRGAAGSERIER